MSSTRFPGKVLAPFRGEPLINHVLRAVRQVPGITSIVVATTREISDDPLVSYLRETGVNVFRGPMNDVFERFRLCAEQFPCDWMVRISADSPLLDPDVIRQVIHHPKRDELDLVTNLFPRTFPKGWTAELIRVRTFFSIAREELTAYDQEHVTPYFYRNASRFRICNLDSGNPDLPKLNLTVDTVEDLDRLERMSEAEIGRSSSAISDSSVA